MLNSFSMHLFNLLSDEVEEKLINEEYKIWKKNTPFLYGKHAHASPTNPDGFRLPRLGMVSLTILLAFERRSGDHPRP